MNRCNNSNNKNVIKARKHRDEQHAPVGVVEVAALAGVGVEVGLAAVLALVMIACGAYCESTYERAC